MSSHLSPQGSLQGELLAHQLPSATAAAAAPVPPAAAFAAPMQLPSAAVGAPMVPQGALLSPEASAAAAAGVAAGFMDGQVPVEGLFGAATAGSMALEQFAMAQHQQQQRLLQFAPAAWQHQTEPGIGAFGQSVDVPVTQQHMAAISGQHILDTASAPALHAAPTGMQPVLAAADLQHSIPQHQLQQQQWGPCMPHEGLDALCHTTPQLQQGLQPQEDTLATNLTAFYTQAGSMGMGSMQPWAMLPDHINPAASAAAAAATAFPGHLAVPLGAVSVGHPQVPAAPFPPAGPPAAAPQQQQHSAAAAAAGEATEPNGLSGLVSQLQELRLEQQTKRLRPKLIQAARTGGNLLACFMQGAGTAQEEQQQHQQHKQEQELQQGQQQGQQAHLQAQDQFVQLLLRCDLLDGSTTQRNLLHLVATHSL